MAGIAATYISATQFSVVGNRVSEFPIGQRLFGFCDYHGAKVVTITRAEYTGGLTIVTVTGDNLTVLLETVVYRKEEVLQNELIWEGESEPPEWFRGVIWIDTTTAVEPTTSTTTTTTTTTTTITAPFDEFDDGVLAPFWSWDAGTGTPDGDYREQGGNLEIDAGEGDIWSGNVHPTWVYQTFSGDFDIYTKVTVGSDLDHNYEQAGIFFYLDDTHWIKTQRDYDNGQKLRVSLLWGGGASHVFSTSYTQLTAYLRIKRVGDVITTYYAAPGDGNWTQSYTNTLSGSDTDMDLGLFAIYWQGNQFTANFAYFRDNNTYPLF